MSILEQVRARAIALWEHAGLMDQPITITAAPLTVEQAIGHPDGQDFPIQKGKERLMEAVFDGAKGQAFTDQVCAYQGRLTDVAHMQLHTNGQRAVFVATVNAVLRSLDKAEGTIHCRDAGPRECASRIGNHLRQHYGMVKIGMAGFQPALIGALSGHFPLRVVDLDPDNIGAYRHGVCIEGGSATSSIIDWADLLLVTGTTLANDSIGLFLGVKPVLFYGTTIAGAARLMDWERYCPCST